MPTIKPIVISITLLIFSFMIVELSLAQNPVTPSPPTAYVPGEILVKFRPNVDLRQRYDLLAVAGGQTLRMSMPNGVSRVQVTPGREAQALVSLQARSDVIYATRNPILVAFNTPDDPDFSKQWGLNNTGADGGTLDADIDAPEAWDVATGSDEVVVAILDSGVDLDHEDLASNIWRNVDEIPDNNIDDDNNGFKDDVNGWDFCKNFGCTVPDNDPNDDSLGSHGTHVAGIAAAVGNNGQGVAGVNWRAKIMAVKVLHGSLQGTGDSIANGIYYAVNNGADVINMSLGQSTSSMIYPCSDFVIIQEAMQAALAQGVLVVVASGNDNNLTNISCPAAFDEALAVGATNYNDGHWEWNGSQGSNGSSRLDVVAPGGSTATNQENGVYSTKKNGFYGYDSGTSMSAPFVSGLASLLLSYEPNLTAPDMRSVVEATVDDLGPTGHDAAFGHGRINAKQALDALVSFRTALNPTNLAVDDRPEAVPVSIKAHLISDDPQPVTWTITLSPTVSWLAVVTSTGVVSAPTSPTVSTLVATRPVTYGVYSTTVVITGVGTGATGLKPLGTRSTIIQITYAPTVYQQYLPFILKSN